ncbi:MAG: hypothetical protein AB7F86_17145 [Bdellovibrionales bacterium]
MRRVWVGLAILLAGCSGKTNEKCGDKFLVLWPSENRNYSFQEVQLKTLRSSLELKGEAAEIFLERGFTSSGFTGSVARPQLTRSGDVCVPQDAQSSVALATYAHFEKLMGFDEGLGIRGFLRWPRKVGIDIHMTSADGRSHNNAHYISGLDITAVIPYSKTGVPLSLNPGIMAHEHFHAYFQTLVADRLNRSLPASLSVEKFFYMGFGAKPTVEDVDTVDLRRVESLNNFVLRGWNEGLADFYGSVFSGRSDFFVESLPEASIYRDLDGKLVPFQKGQVLVDMSGATDRANLLGYTYGQGTVLARFLTRFAEAQGLLPRELLQRILVRLPEVAELMRGEYSKTVMDSEKVVPVLLRDLTLKSRACTVLTSTLSKELLHEKYRECLE